MDKFAISYRQRKFVVGGRWMVDESGERSGSLQRRDISARADADAERIRTDEWAILERRRKDRIGSRNDKGTTGLSLSGGGIRSAAVCIGAMQALNARGRFNSIDYLSTVSGGGYAGACLSASLCEAQGAAFPFGGDVRDTDVIAHIRNYSNYLLPRSQSGFRNWSEASSILLRGLVANAICVIAFGLIFVALTAIAFSRSDREHADPNFLPRLAENIYAWAVQYVGSLPDGVEAWTRWPAAHIGGFQIPILIGFVLACVLCIWAGSRTIASWDGFTNDTTSPLLSISRWLVLALALALFLDIQPLLLVHWRCWLGHLERGIVGISFAALGTAAATVVGFASKLGSFLESTKRSTRSRTILLRALTKVAIYAAALVLPLLLWLAYLAATTALITYYPAVSRFFHGWGVTGVALVILAFWIIMCCFRPNGYSLHRLYRDRLSKAFLVSPIDGGDKGTARIERDAERTHDLPPLDRIRLSDLQHSNGPYPLINAALNVQGSAEANRRGREADFFVFTPDRVGSPLVGYVPITMIEEIDKRLDLGTAMAISGAAASANMGGSTIRALSPTLSLLNIRLGYYLVNPRWLLGAKSWTFYKTWWSNLQSQAFLLLEMFNGLDEKRATVYLTDGGHIENLGIYELLRRRCDFILAIDSEADPDIGCGALLKLERFARIDLGIRIYLPWSEIRDSSREVSDGLAEHNGPERPGPHAAIGSIHYDDGTSGTLLYVKSSLSGDEADYVLDYAMRNPRFPHETTGDQFFSEEQFEMYRALGFHMVYRLFGDDLIAFDTRDFVDRAAVHAEIARGLCEGPVLYSPGEAKKKRPRPA